MMKLLHASPVSVPTFSIRQRKECRLLAAGDMVPGDGCVLKAKDFFVNQALLTGEPYPVEKLPGEFPGEPDVLSSANTVLLGTSVISGSAKVLICRTGVNTVLGDNYLL